MASIEHNRSHRTAQKHVSRNDMIATIIAIILPVLFDAPSFAQTPPSGCELRPVLLEEFDSLSIAPWTIGPARWIAHTPWNGDFGDARFTDPGPDGPFQIENGMLVITAAKNADGKWTSGLIAASDATGAGTGAQYGYFEVRMKMPPGPGTWPAFWLQALKPVATSDGNVEIDVIEYYGQLKSTYQAVVHVWYKDTTKKRMQAKTIPVLEGALVSDFHTYGVDISPTKIVFFLDGKAMWSQPTPRELNTKMFPLVNLALGSGYPIDQTPNPSKLYVDYVRIYERDTGPPEGCPPGLNK